MHQAQTNLCHTYFPTFEEEGWTKNRWHLAAPQQGAEAVCENCICYNGISPSAFSAASAMFLFSFLDIQRVKSSFASGIVSEK